MDDNIERSDSGRGLQISASAMEPHHTMFADEIAWFFNTKTNLNLSQVLEY